jgi:hypothetical protein
MNINGKNGLACLTNMRTLQDPIVLKPLPGLPVIRDLIVDMTQFFKQYNSIKPYLVNDETAAREGAPAVARRARRAERPVRVHPVRELLDQLPELLVEPRQVRRARPAAAGPTASSPTAATRPPPERPGQPRRPVPPVRWPHDHELRRRLPERPNPTEGDRQDQGMMVRRPQTSMKRASTNGPIKAALALPRGLLENELFSRALLRRHAQR